MHPITPIYSFPAQCFPNCKVFMNHLEILLNYKTQTNRPCVGPRVCISDQSPGAAVAQGGRDFGQGPHPWRSFHSTLLTHFHSPRAGAHSPGSSQGERKSKDPLSRGEGWQDHSGRHDTLRATPPTLRSRTWPNNCDF